MTEAVAVLLVLCFSVVILLVALVAMDWSVNVSGEWSPGVKRAWRWLQGRGRR